MKINSDRLEQFEKWEIDDTYKMLVEHCAKTGELPSPETIEKVTGSDYELKEEWAEVFAADVMFLQGFALNFISKFFKSQYDPVAGFRHNNWQ